jgi:hypothetical protein
MATPSEKGIGRLLYQFRDSENLIKFLLTFLEEFNELEVSRLQLLNERWLDTAYGVQLDIIGEIVGLVRPQRPVAVAGVFGFEGDDSALGFGSTTDPLVGGNFWDGKTPTVPVNDSIYRLLIRAKIIKNQTAMTVDDTLRLISFTFGGVVVRYFQNPYLEPQYEIYKNLSAFELSILPDLPVLIGIEKAFYTSVPEDVDGQVFSFDGDDSPNAAGFGTTADPDIGGNFSTIV